ncbi:zinc metalloproteinase nas-14-like isoform X2 [Clytia hemisphaerica]|uniref:zinc metalloproteinase nas-14-like isoform X2 n=1 Tax=Clytia hemisphaerica TaxID=252671 RepID=UPI0034D57A51
MKGIKVLLLFTLLFGPIQQMNGRSMVNIKKLISDLRHEVKELKDVVAEKKADENIRVNDEDAEPPLNLADDSNDAMNDGEMPPIELADVEDLDEDDGPVELLSDEEESFELLSDEDTMEEDGDGEPPTEPEIEFDDREKLKRDFSGMTEDEINAEVGYKGEEMKLTDQQRKRGVGTNIRLWGGSGTVHFPYKIDSSFSSSDRQLIITAIEELNGYLEGCNGLKLHETYSFSNIGVVHFKWDTGCWSYLGKTDLNPQPIGLHYGCAKKGIIQHEILHALGFNHEQSRTDRDNFVEIQWENIQAGKESNFKKMSDMTLVSQKSKYDYESVMHFSNTTFSKNGKETIVAAKNAINPPATFGQRDHLTELDKEELRAVYGCSGLPPPSTTTTTTTTKKPPTTTITQKPPTTLFTEGPTTTKKPLTTTITQKPPTTLSTEKPGRPDENLLCKLVTGDVDNGTVCNATNFNTTSIKRIYGDGCKDVLAVCYSPEVCLFHEWFQRHCPVTCGKCKGEYNRTSSKAPRPTILGSVDTKLSGKFKKSAAINCGNGNPQRVLDVWMSTERISSSAGVNDKLTFKKLQMTRGKCGKQQGRKR